MSRCRRSGCSARAATARSSPAWSAPGFSFAHHFSDYDAAAAMLQLPRAFPAVGGAPAPYAISPSAAVCADSDAEAERLPPTLDLNWARRARGELGRSRARRMRWPFPTRRSTASASAIAARACSSARPRRSLARLAPMIEADQGRRGHGHHDDLRSRGAPAFLRAAGARVRPAAQGARIKSPRTPGGAGPSCQVTCSWRRRCGLAPVDMASWPGMTGWWVTPVVAVPVTMLPWCRQLRTLVTGPGIVDGRSCGTRCDTWS